MSYRTSAFAVAALAALSAPAAAQKLPAVQLSPANQPSQCMTPGRMMAFLQNRNPRLAERFRTISVDYIRHGRDLGIRWDYAFYQMVVETNSLKYTGDVSSHQNNFAGLGATGGGVKGESFRTVSDGVRAHLQHLMLYAGIRVDDPIADRTRKVQSWGILDKWRSRVSQPVTYSDVGTKWAPVDRRYSDHMRTIAAIFMNDYCNRRDPAPELLAMLDGGAGQRSQQAAYDTAGRAGLGAMNAGSAASATVGNRSPGAYRTLNAPNGAAGQSTAAKFAAPGIQPPEVTEAKCRVWTASYGGQKATIIKSSADDTTNYTVLDVNNGREDAEAKAYIAAYAKGGQRIGDFADKAAAMERAFKLCPKG